MKKNVRLKTLRKVEVRSNFCASTQKFKILTIPNVLAYEKSYEHGFTKKKCYDHNLCAKSRFDRYFVLRLSRKFKILPIPNVLAHEKSFKILSIPNILPSGKLYKHDFMKKT
ncbi:hypothetical protein B296_00001138 [Ensete ventricosum]|uniref:Uncharacterized protein n=1 Tax=Ensete ventricosum TaxID=4639 RepID=A0A427BAM5_ENSVE|nr:hypothetical protein B296_00001138 [Ensete ventricosum]